MINFQKERNVLESMNNISSCMRDIILNNYYDAFGNQAKYLFSLFIDAYKTVDIFCIAMQEMAVKQAGVLLRLLLDEVSIVTILTREPNLLPEYIEHYKFKVDTLFINKKEQIKLILEKYKGKVTYNKALAYLDYGWLPLKKNELDEIKMIEYADFKELESWKSFIFDKLAHSSYTNTTLMGEKCDSLLYNQFTKISAKLFDYLCYAFHKYTQFDFIINESDYFAKFRENYQNIMTE